MHILQVCKKPPWPAHDGETVAITNLAQGLVNSGHQVTIAAIATPKHPLVSTRITLETHGYANLHTVFVDTTLRTGPALTNLLFSRAPYQITRFLSAEFSSLLQRLVREVSFDIIQLEGLALTEYLPVIRHSTKIPVVMRSHNVEHRIWSGIARHERRLLRRLYLMNLARRLKRYELQHLNDYDGVVPITETDAEVFRSAGCRIPMLPLPMGIDMNIYRHNGIALRDHLFIFGSWDWIPNQDGLRWFAREVWPAIRKRLPSLRLVIAGRNAPEEFQGFNVDGMEFIGEVDSAPAFYKRNGVMVVPLLSGSGLRIKIVEAMAAGVPVVSTTVGAQGIQARSGEHLMIADEPEAFSDAIVRCISSAELQQTLSHNASALAQQEFDITRLSEKLVAFYRKLAS